MTHDPFSKENNKKKTSIIENILLLKRKFLYFLALQIITQATNHHCSKLLFMPM